MKIHETMARLQVVIGVSLLFMSVSLTSFAGIRMDDTQAKKTALDQYRQLIDSESVDELNSLLQAWNTTLSQKDSEYLYEHLIQCLNSKNNLPSLSQEPGVNKHDLSLEAGRCALALDHLLKIDLPAIVRESDGNQITTARQQALFAVLEAPPIPYAIDLSGMSRKQRLAMAESPTTEGEVLALLVANSSEKIRLAIAKNPNTSVRTLFGLLKNDKSEKVREEAAKSLEKATIGNSISDLGPSRLDRCILQFECACVVKADSLASGTIIS